MPISRARLLILLYGLLLALGFVYLAVADDPSTAGDRSPWLVISALIVLGLWKGSSLAWGVAVFLNAATIFSMIAMGAPGLTPYVLLVLASGALWILVSPEVRAHVRSGGTRLASS